MTDMDYALGLVPTTQATKTALQSGLWSSTSTWGGVFPATGDKVFIPSGIVVTLDTQTPSLTWLRVDGQLLVKPDVVTQLWTKLCVTSMGSLFQIGTDTSSVIGQFTYKFGTFTPDLAADPLLMGGGLLVLGQFIGCGQPCDAWVDLTTAEAGSTSLTCTTAPNGWLPGNKLVLAGLSAVTLQNEVVTIQSIAGPTVTLTLPLQFKHTGGIALLQNRKVTFMSEIPGAASGGHVMLMNSNMTDLCHVAFIGMGRTNKTIPVTDPDGSGGGTGNVRGRYACHNHKCGPNISGDPSNFEGLYLEGGQGWQFVNHDSRAAVKNCGSYRPISTAYVTEIGTETGSFDSCASIGELRPSVTLHSDSFNNSDWGHNEYDFWLQCGQVPVTNSRAFGFVSGGLIMGQQFAHPDPVLFLASNLVAPPRNNLYVNVPPVVSPASVPQVVTKRKVGACVIGLLPWELNSNPAFDWTKSPYSENPDFLSGWPPVEVGWSVISDCVMEVQDSAIFNTYLSWVKIFNCTLKRVGGSPNLSLGIGHSGFSGQIIIQNTTIDGFGTGIETGTDLQNTIDGITFLNCNRGIQVLNKRPRYGRRIEISNCIFTNTPRTVELRYDAPGINLYDGEGYWEWHTSCSDQFGFPDVILLDGKRLYFPEEMDNFVLPHSSIVPTAYQGLTNAQLYQQTGLRIGGKIPPADCVPIPNGIGFMSSTPPVILPIAPTPPPSTVTVPNVVGLPLAQASSILQAIGLVMSQVVSAQDPLAGVNVQPGSTVKVT